MFLVDYAWDYASAASSLSTPGVDYTTISLWTNCNDCVTTNAKYFFITILKYRALK